MLTTLCRDGSRAAQLEPGVTEGQEGQSLKCLCLPHAACVYIIIMLRTGRHGLRALSW